MIDLLREVRLAGRQLRKNTGYASVVAVTLALAIGANTIIFAFADLFLLRPLPIGDASRAVTLYSVDTQRGVQRAHTSLADFLDWRAQATAFEQLAAFSRTAYTMTGSGDPMRINALLVTANLPSMWELKTVAGRTFLPGEDQPAAARTVVLSHRFWKEHFASDRAIVGRWLTLNGAPFTVVGVLTDEIEIGNLAEIDVWVPMRVDVAAARDDRTLSVSGHLKRGATVDQATAELATIAHRLEQAYPVTNIGWSARAVTMRESIAGPQAWIVLVLLVVVVLFVLVIACANVANMMLARATVRSKELAVRLALGATRGRLAAQLVTESLQLGLAGGALGLLVAYGGLKAVQAGSNEPFFQLLAINGRVLAFTTALSILAPILFSLLPALQTSRADVTDALKENSRRTSGGGRGRRSRAILVASQLALSLMLLVVAGLITRTVAAAEHAPLGIDPSQVLSLEIQLDAPKYPDEARAVAFTRDLTDRLRQLPNVRAAAFASAMPIVDGEPVVRFHLQGARAATANDTPWANTVAIGGDYLSVFRIRLAAGRAFSVRDDAAAPAVALISQEAVRRYWGAASPIGAHIEVDGPGGGLVEIVGIVDDVATTEVTQPMPPRLYRPLGQHASRSLALVLRTDGDPAAIAPSVRAAIRTADVDLAVSRMEPFERLVLDVLREDRVLVGMFVAFALVALLMAGAGLYGVTAYAVSQRTQEIGIRMALGATRRDVLRMIAVQNGRIIGAGAGIGVLGGLGLGAGMRALLYKVGATDPATFVPALTILTLVALVATYLPAWRATRINPVDSMRVD